MVFQIVLLDGLEGGPEEDLFRLDIAEFPDQAFVNGPAVAHFPEGIGQQFIKVPVHQIIFVQKVPVKGLAGYPGLPGDFLYGDVFQALPGHQPFHRLCQPVFAPGLPGML